MIVRCQTSLRASVTTLRHTCCQYVLRPLCQGPQDRHRFQKQQVSTCHICGCYRPFRTPRYMHKERNFIVIASRQRYQGKTIPESRDKEPGR